MRQAVCKRLYFRDTTLMEESNAEESPAEQKNAELKNANLPQNSHSLIPHFLSQCGSSHSLIPHFLNSRSVIFQMKIVQFQKNGPSFLVGIGLENQTKIKKKYINFNVFNPEMLLRIL